MLDDQQVLYIDGTVSGTTRVGVSGTIPEDWVYLSAPSSEIFSFELVNTGWKLERNERGEWSAVRDLKEDGPKTQPEAFEITETIYNRTLAEMDVEGLVIPVECQLSGEDEYFVDIPLEIAISKDGGTTAPAERFYMDSVGYSYAVESLGFAEIFPDEGTSSLYFYTDKEGNSIAVGVYTITISAVLSDGTQSETVVTLNVMGDSAPASGTMGSQIRYTIQQNGTVSVTAETSLTEPVYVLLVSYDSGQMLACDKVNLSAGESKDLSLTGQGERQVLFALSAQYAPLCPAQEL